MNLYPNSLIFDYVDSILSYLSKNIKIHNLSPQFIIRFDQISKKFFENTLILCGFDPYLSLYYLICDYFSKLMSLVIIFYVSLQVFNDLAVSLSQHTPLSSPP